jgi:hypothetical protein
MTSELAMNTCQSCGAEIQWTRTAEGHSIPLDKVPVADGTIELVIERGQMVARVLTKPQLARLRENALPGLIPKLYTSHFSTCEAAQWRKS